MRASRRGPSYSKPGRAGARPIAVLAVLAVLAPLVSPADVGGQYSIAAPSGRSIDFDRLDLLAWRDRSDALRESLDQDPLILYYTSYGPALSPEQGDEALPWNAVEVVTDSLAAVITPGNLREADRAYYSYAVLRMNAVREDPDVECSELVAREMRAVNAFVEGWIVARTLYGGPPYEPLDELAFARADGVLEGLVADRSDRQLAGCLAVWRDGDPALLERYRAWRRDRTPGDGGG